MPTVEMERRQVVVIGAGPSGAIAAALLKRKGHDVLVIERQHFPRFSIGESLLSHCLDFVEEAGMLEAVNAAGFQRKNGAAFAWGERYSAFDFGDTFSKALEGVQTGADGSTTLCKLTEMRQARIDALDVTVELCNITTEFLAKSQGSSVLQVRSANLDDLVKSIHFLLQGVS